MGFDIKAGDTAHHKPSGEDWVILRAGEDSEGKFVEPAGYPPCRARMSDCRLIKRGGGVSFILDHFEATP